ncbi:MAG TPA: carboxypeptidase regulatory-like domain-containing protein [Bryobacteraceae bacterium]|nr:carboxypeptidase regulatory-like domain-containing protein [Bryobacteraceae bacterium]
MWKKLPKISLLALVSLATLAASESHGVVKYGGLPLPGATVTATEGNKKFVAVTDANGNYSFPDLADGVWTIQAEMLCFATAQQQITVSKDAPATEFDLKLLPVDQIKAIAGPAAPTVSVAAPEAKPGSAAFQRTDVNASAAAPPAAQNPSPNQAFGNASESELSQRANDGLLINGTTNNGAASPFAQAQAFGNNRNGFRPLYTGGIGLTLNNSALDARPFSITGQNTARPAYDLLTGLLSFGGPLKIPHLFDNGPFFVVNYQWTRNRSDSDGVGLMPTAAERAGMFTSPVTDPLSGMPFAGNIIPASRISAQAQALLNYYPLPNFTGPQYNYQIPLVSPTNMDALQTRMNKTIGRKNQLYGNFALLSTRADTPSVFDFLDTTDTLGINTGINWRHTLTPRLFGTLGVQYSRFSTRTKSFFENRENVSGAAGINGNNQDPMYWGPPTLGFSSGISGLSDATPVFNRNQTSAVSYSLFWYHSPHNVTFGVDYKRQQMNDLGQQNPRGAFTFTGAATGDDFADFLLGVPDTSNIAFGNADKYFRDSLYDAYANDDWRVNPELTINWGLRWEYGSPITEKYGRLVNLDIAPGFSAVAPVIATDPVGPLTGEKYAPSLMNPDRTGIEPRVALAWRPISGSSMVIRAGYGVYYNTSVYSQIATQMAQQYPLSKSLSVANSPADPLTLANGFNASPTFTPDLFAVDPNFRVGYSQNWQASVQRDLPGALVMTATYLGIKGTRGMQEFLPNSYPIGAANPCPACPSGFVYLTSNGNSTREAGELQLRRRLQSGFAAQLQYTYSKSIDDDAVLGGNSGIATVNSGGGGMGPAAAVTVTSGSSSQAAPMIAQNWLNLAAERSLSSFDQRNLLNFTLQYTTGMGMHGGTLLSGWKGALLKEWTISTSVNAGSGLPLTPVYLAAAPGTGVTGSIRPEYTGANLYATSGNLALNPAAYAAPSAGEWGNAGRNSITGPAQFSLNASLGRTFRVSDRLNLDLRVDSTNALNHVNYSSWGTTINNSLFGVPVSANPMRSMATTLRLRF